jgi:FkbM family methyltransferase
MNPKRLVRSALRRAGFDLSRLSSPARNRNQPADDPFLHQQLLTAGTDVRTVFDVGANRGQTAAKYRTLFPAATVFSFEPFPESFAALRQTFAGDPRVRPFQLALSDEAGTKTFHTSADSVMNSLLPLSPQAGMLTDSRAAGAVQVEATTLDLFCHDHGVPEIDILKLDVQGGELHVLRGAAGLLRDRRVRLVYAEVNFNELYAGQAFFHDVAAHVYGCGYTLYGLYQIAYSPRGPIGWADALFVSPAVLERLTGG